MHILCTVARWHSVHDAHIYMYILGRIIEGDEVRRKMHNTILELKGNVRVFCRVRPSSESEAVEGNGKCLDYPYDGLENENRKILLNAQGKEHSFAFDRVFTEGSTQNEVCQSPVNLLKKELSKLNAKVPSVLQFGFNTKARFSERLVN